MRVLVVEDHPDTRDMLRRMIESMGYAVDESTNRKDGIAMLLGDPDIGVVLLDLGLPPAEHDFTEGIGFLKEAALRSSLTKIIVLTGQEVSQATLSAIEHGAFDYLQKPCDHIQLSHAIERAALFYQSHSTMRGESKVSMYIVADASTDSSVKGFKDHAMIRLLRTVLAETGHNVSEAARRLNIGREHLYYYLKKYGIERPDE